MKDTLPISLEPFTVRVLVVAPHPDDDILGCGGVMARYAAAGDEVHVVVMTRGIPEVFDQDQIEQGRRELREAHAVLGVKGLQFLDFPAPRLDTVPRHQISDTLTRIVRELKPHTMYVPHPGDMHFEHGITYEGCLVAARPLNAERPRRVLAYETLSETEWGPPIAGRAFQPTTFVDISPYLEKKLQAMACMKSQLLPSPHPRSLAALEGLARLRGSTAAMEAAEAFMLVREVVR